MHVHREVRLAAWLLVCVAMASCGASEKSTHNPIVPPNPAGVPPNPAGVVGSTWDLCTMLGPSTNRPGVYGSDLGISVPLPSAAGQPGQLAMLFGDTWAEATDVCAYPVMKSDDLQVTLPAARPQSLVPGQPMAAGADPACGALQYTLAAADDPASWPHIRLFRDASVRSDDAQLDTGMLRTPVAAFSDGAHTFGMFIRDETLRCASTAECLPGTLCSNDPVLAPKRVGGCQPQVALTSDSSPAFCRDDSDCAGAAVCGDLAPGVCLAPTPFSVQRNGQPVAPPTWYEEDPRRGVLRHIYVASAFWPDRPQDYATGFRFATNKFVNLSARGIKHFDPTDPSRNDYSPGYETLLLWGRPTFAATEGWQSLAFLAYQPLANLLDPTTGAIAWAPKYFAGFGPDGKPRWSDSELEAEPIYGVDENLDVQNGQLVWNWKQPEFDYVNQMSVSYLAPLGRWVMLYGGDAPAFTVSDPKTGMVLPPAYPQSAPGAIYLRSAAHPWGRGKVDASAAEAWSVARPLWTREAAARYLACDDDNNPSNTCAAADQRKQPTDVLDAIGDLATQLAPDDWIAASATCIAGNAALELQYSLGGDSSGHLYGVNLIQEWTEDVTGRHGGERAVEIYWNVSTWNPYQVVLVKSQLKASDLR